MSRTARLTFACLALLASTSLARGDDPPTPVSLRTATGSTTPATIRLKSIRVVGDLGTLEIPLAKVRWLALTQRTDANGRPFHSVQLRSGAVIVGMIDAGEALSLTIEFGETSVHWQDVQLLDFDPAPPTAPTGPPPAFGGMHGGMGGMGA